MDILLLKPADAFSGKKRLLPSLQSVFTSTDYNVCRIIVAFARLSGVARLLPHIRTWKSKGNLIQAVVGIDQLGTSREALEVMLNEFESVFVARTTVESCTFHPKMYLFQGPTKAKAFIGSNNFTLGGMELNFECAVSLDFDLPAEQGYWNQFTESWDQLLPGQSKTTLKLDSALLGKLVSNGLLLQETRIIRAARKPPSDTGTGTATAPPDPFPAIAPSPPSPLPHSILPELKTKTPKTADPAAITKKSSAWSPRALVMEIAPHHNGEIFLSKSAADAFPDFFGMPFTGRTIPKKTTNPGYPMRVPDPQIEWRVYGAKGQLIHSSRFGLNTVLYEKKSEIRITVTPPLVKIMPEYSVMVMSGESSRLPSGLDYVIDVHVPGSPGQKQWDSAMNIMLPGGGKKRARRMGWV
jgi:HKD family nuclease